MPNRGPPSGDVRRLASWRVAVCILGLLVLASGALVLLQLEHKARASYATTFPEVPQAAVNPYGVNVSLAECDEEELERTLRMVEDGGFHWVRQTFPWAEIEPQPGEYDWERWDRIVSAIRRHGLEVIAVLDTSPIWAQLHPSGNPHTPPRRVEDFGRFARALAERYGEEIDYYQIWDEPNLSAHWGDRYIDPAQYARLLREGYIQIKSADERAYILTAGLAPNIEKGPLNLNEPAFLHRLYEAGGKGFFDIVAIKPYGFWTGPDDRRVDPAILNFSRAQLVREVMVDHGDEEKAVWAVEFGWNSLPEGWQGEPSIWGEVSEDEQAVYAAEAIRRALDEWPWMGVMAWSSFRPHLPPDDPHWGFALVDRRWKPRPVYVHLQETARREPIAHVGYYPADHYTAKYEGYWRLSPLGADIGRSGDKLVIPFKGTRLDLSVRRGDFWGLLYVTIDGKPANALPHDEEGRSYLVLYDPLHGVETVTLAKGLPDAEHKAEIVAEGGWGQWAIVGWRVSREPNLRLYHLAWAVWGIGAIAFLAAGGFRPLLSAACPLLRELANRYRALNEWLQVALMALAAASFYFSPWLPLTILGLTLLALLIYLRLDLGLALTAFAIPFFLYPKQLLSKNFSTVEILTLLCFAAWLVQMVSEGREAKGKGRMTSMGRCDWAVVFFVAVSAASLLWAGNRGVAIREFRVVILEPALFYFLLRILPLKRRDLWRIVDALLLSAVVVSSIGLYQFLAGKTIAAEGVRRVRGVYGSPNNLGLFLGRIVPLLVAVAFLGRSRRRCAAYCAAGLPIIACLYLTYSRGAWLLGLPAAFLFLGMVHGRRALLISLIAISVIALSLTPLIGTKRLASTFELGGGTAFFRLKLWQSAVNMIHDHPLTGVGLDNFLYEYRTRYILPTAWQEANLSHPHNIVLDYWTRLGLLGVVALLWLEIAFFGRGLKLRRSLNDPNPQALIMGLMASMVDLLAHGLIDNAYFLVDLAFVFFLTLGIVAYPWER